jgi:hypothetical protein
VLTGVVGARERPRGGAGRAAGPARGAGPPLSVPQPTGDQQRRPQRAARRQLDHLVGLAGGARHREQLGQLPFERGVELVGAGARRGGASDSRADQADHDGVRVDGGR